MEAEAPRFVICKRCGKHGRIILTDEFVGTEVFSVEYALYMIDAALQYERLLPEEARSLTEEVMESTLPREDDEVDSYFRQVVSAWNQYHADVGDPKGNPDSDEHFHRFLNALLN